MNFSYRFNKDSHITPGLGMARIGAPLSKFLGVRSVKSEGYRECFEWPRIENGIHSNQ